MSLLQKTLNDQKNGSGFPQSKSEPRNDKSATQKTDPSILRGSCVPWSLKLSLQMKGGEARQVVKEKQLQLYSTAQL